MTDLCETCGRKTRTLIDKYDGRKYYTCPDRYGLFTMHTYEGECGECDRYFPKKWLKSKKSDCKANGDDAQ